MTPTRRLFTLMLLSSVAMTAQPRTLLKRARPGREGALRSERSLVNGRVHRIVAESELAEAEASGARVLRPVPGGAWVVSGYKWDLPQADLLLPPDKLSAELDSSSRAFLVEFHPDVEPGEARQIALNCGLRIREHPDLRTDHLLVEGSLARAEELAGWDEVAYIFPAAQDLVKGRPAIPCAGALAGDGTYGQYVARSGDGWDGPGLGSAALGFGFGYVTRKVDSDAAKAEVARALAEWTKFIRLTFTPVTATDAPRTIRIHFAVREHGDAYPFDGPRGVLAHTFYPAPPNPEPLAGDMHFDDDEAWRIGADVDLYSVALHEAGHALGLGHSDRPGDVMYPYYRRATTLSVGDIAAVREMYASRDDNATPPAVPPLPPAQPPATPATPPVQPAPAPAPAPSPRDTTPPSLSIASPAAATSYTTASSVSLRGTASDNVGVAKLTWSSLTASGTVNGTSSWSTPAIALLTGTNVITIRAYDAAGNSSWRAVTIIRR